MTTERDEFVELECAALFEELDRRGRVVAGPDGQEYAYRDTLIEVMQERTTRFAEHLEAELLPTVRAEFGAELADAIAADLDRVCRKMLAEIAAAFPTRN
jgi:hypothetical protein